MKIAHIADVHIRLKDRHDEYRQVFTRLYNDLMDQRVDAIVLAGDIVHSKITMSPELVVLLSEFIASLANIAPVRIIVGNHDMNVSNRERLDALSPIVDPLVEFDYGVLYMKKTGYYKDPVFNIVWGVNSLLDSDSPSVRLTKEMKQNDLTYIALYHGPIAGCVLNGAYVFSEAATSIRAFENFDIVMLGDIHKRQFLNDEETAAYCGTLVQQNHGEELSKGYLIWDTETRKATFRQIENDYGYFTIVATDQVLPDVTLPKNCRLRVIWPVKPSTVLKSEVIKMNSFITNKYKPHSLQLLFKPDHQDSHFIKTDDSVVIAQEHLLQEFFGEGYDIAPIIELDKKINDEIVSTEHESFNGASWSLKRVRIHNFMSYAGPVEIDFSNLQGVIGLFGDNAAGKSVIIDAILYALFNKVTRDVKNENLVNTKIPDMFCNVELDIEINGVEYQISRTTTRLYRKDDTFINAKTAVTFKRKTDDGWENISDIQRTETEKVIRNAVGSYDDFIITALSSQDGSDEFLYQKSAQRSDNMLRFLGLEMFAKKHDCVKERLRTTDLHIKTMAGDQELEKHDVYTEELVGIKEECVLLEDEKLLHSERLKQLLDEITSTSEQINTSIPIEESVDVLENEVKLLTDSIKTMKETRNGIIIGHDVLLAKVKDIEDAYVVDNDKIIVLSKQVERADKIKSELSRLSRTLDLKKNSLTLLRRDIDSDNKCPVAYDPNHSTCPYLKGFVSKVDQTEKLIAEAMELKDEELKLREELEDLKFAYIALKEQSDIQQHTVTAMSKLEAMRRRKVDLDNKIEVKEVSLKLTKSKLNLAKKHAHDIAENERLRNVLASLKVARDVEQSKRDECVQRIISYAARIKYLEEKLADIETKMQKMLELERNRSLYTDYCMAMHRNGIPISILRNHLPEINYEINRILSDVVSFGVFLTLDPDSTSIDITMRGDGEVDDTRPAQMACGMEKRLINFAIRYALISISTLNKPSMWFIDEGFGVLDANNMYMMRTFFDNVQDIFTNIVIITHIDAMKDVANHVITVDKKDGISRVSIPTKNI